MSQIESEMSVDLVDMEAGLGKKIKSLFSSFWRARKYENMNANFEKCRVTKEFGFGDNRDVVAPKDEEGLSENTNPTSKIQQYRYFLTLQEISQCILKLVVLQKESYLISKEYR